MKFNTVMLSEVAEVGAGNSAPQDKKLFNGGKYPFIRTSDVGKIKVGTINKTVDKLNENGIKKLKLFSTGTILFPKSGASTFLNYRVLMGEDSYVSSHLATIKANTDKVLDKYLWYFLQTIDSANLIPDSDYPSVNLKVIQKIATPLPSLNEQKQTIKKLEELLPEIDNALIKFKAQIIKTNELSERLGEIYFNNKDYPEHKLSDVCEFIGGSQPPKSVFEKAPTEKNIRLIQIRDYKSDKHIVYIPKKLAKRYCDKTDIMIGRYGPPIFQILRGIEGSYNVALMKAVPNKKIEKNYLFYFLKNKKIQNYIINKSSRAAGQTGLNKQALEPYIINLPPLDIQNKIVKKVDEVQKNIEIYTNSLTEKIKHLHSLRLSILSDIFKNKT
ncbi:restriction endonuclease subunit S [Methylophilaceae bacterium]|nr:restriction endonuclease subunit S [Methylophilaceae bacterium]